MSDQELRQAVLDASRRADVLAAVGQVYTDLQAAIAARRPACQRSGRCCRFDEYGHRLYVTTMELAAFVAQLHGPGQDRDGRGCPFQVGPLCGAHAIRPLGCRAFYCDASAVPWQADVYEQFHARLKKLHQAMGVAYFYVEWRRALGAVLSAKGPGLLNRTL